MDAEGQARQQGLDAETAADVWQIREAALALLEIAEVDSPMFDLSADIKALSDRILKRRPPRAVLTTPPPAARGPGVLTSICSACTKPFDEMAGGSSFGIRRMCPGCKATMDASLPARPTVEARLGARR